MTVTNIYSQQILSTIIYSRLTNFQANIYYMLYVNFNVIIRNYILDLYSTRTIKFHFSYKPFIFEVQIVFISFFNYFIIQTWGVLLHV